MVQNLRVDIIYHMSPSDFEMEFNLSGCCRMRLLSDKTNDKKSFIKALARDVSRSRVIIACGPLFGSDGLISTVATAIGNGTTVCNNKTYGINSDETIHIINGSTPLVTADGYFCGCIIESGPQTIILLTENKTFRKSVMKTLIHPYIEEISYIPSGASKVTAPVAEEEPQFETAVSEEENYLTQPDETDDAAADQSEVVTTMPDEHNIAFIMDDESPTTQIEAETAPVIDTAYDMLYTDVETPEEKKARYNDSYTASESDSMFIADSLLTEEEDEERNEQKGGTLGLDITIVILVLLLLLAVLALVFLVVVRPMSMGIGVMDYIKDIFGLASNTLV